MADAGTMFRSLPSDQRLGDYNGITKVLSSTTVAFTGSNAGAAFICEVVTNVVVHGSGGGTIPGTSLTADTLYPIGVKKVAIGASGIVYVLHR
ncbi:hypothetical protein HOK09_03195 [Candidatus Woesearchaeota archaeon]|nr:hypothetical protein [Candidatus Woesearchaeota archaeon]